MKQKILIMGLPGSGKTTLANELKPLLSNNTSHLNGDEIRKFYDDWDFSIEGRLRQAERMRDISDLSNNDYIVIDFVCPLEQMRNIVNPDWIIWVDTIEKSRYEDTNKTFVPPKNYDFRVTEQDAKKWSAYIAEKIINNIRRPIFDWRKETVQMLGRFQPWHLGHRSLFERAIAKTGQVCIMIRDCQGWQNSNPFAIEEVKNYIHRDLDPLYQGMYEILIVPNIVEIVYGRDVGYKINKIELSEDIQAISATKIRKEMGFV